MGKQKLYIANMDNASYAKAIKAKCADCSGGEKNGVRDCHIVKCPLWPYRFGCSPNTAQSRYKGYDIVLVDVNKVDYIEQLEKG